MTTLYLGGESHLFRTEITSSASGTAHLEIRQKLFVGDMPSFLAFSRDGRRALAISEGDDRLILLGVDGEGSLSVLSEAPCPGGPAYVAFDRSDRFALTASYGSGESRIYGIEGDVLVGPLSTLATGKYTHALVPSLDNRLLFAPSKGTDRIAVLSFDAESGRSEIVGEALAPGGSGPRHLALSPDGRRAFVSGENDCSLLAYRIEGRTLVGCEHQRSLPRAFAAGDSGADVHRSEDGRFVYVSNRGHDSIATFRLGGGAPTLVGHESTRGKVPRNFCLIGADLLVVANQESNSLALFSRDRDSGALTFESTVPTPERPFWVGNQQSF